jgi:type IV pilus assembly protein PilY1
VDGPVTVTEAWLGSGTGLNNKNAGDWRTLLILGLGKGVRESHSNSDPKYLWSSSPNCDSGFSRKYNPPHHYYCGYYAFDVTDTSRTQPVFKWRINLTNWRQGIYLDEPWSKMAIGRVRIDGDEKWVGFIGGGFSGDEIKKRRDYDDDDFELKGKRGGKGVHVVDLSNGNILWSFTNDDDSNMDYPIPASPAVVDWDSDGFIDTAYVADLGGNLWRFRFCSYEDYRNDQSCNTADWKGGRLFASTTGYDRPVFSRPTVAADQANQLWVFWGTGNKLSPSDTGSQENFFAVKDTFVPVKSGTSPPGYTISNLQNIGSTNYSGVLPGWYLPLPGSGEKSLSDPTVFGGMVLFTTYTPAPSVGITCDSAGTGRLYAMAMMPMVINGVTFSPGAGLWAGGARSISLGTGIPTAPVVSQKPKDKP